MPKKYAIVQVEVQVDVTGEVDADGEWLTYDSKALDHISDILSANGVTVVDFNCSEIIDA